VKLKKQDHLAVLRIVLTYSTLGTLWIYLSDSVLGMFTKDPAILTEIAMVKGVLFIFFTSALLYALIARRVKKIKESEKLLYRSEERFKQIAENAEEIIWEVNKDSLFTYISPIVKVILGYSVDEIIGKMHLYDFVDLPIRERVKSRLENIFSGGAILKGYIITLKHKNGNDVIFEVNASPVISPGGILIGYRGANIDITERKNAEAALLKSEEKYRTLIKASPDAILMLNIKGDIILANDQCALMHGYESSSEMTGLNASCLIPPEELSHIYSNLEKVLMSSRPINDEFVFLKADGERFFAELSLAVMLNDENKPEAVIGIAKNISSRKKTEFELEKYRAQLEELVKERTAELEEVNEKLKEEILKQKEAEEKVMAALEKEKELNILKSEFITTASHEFRTPLATILSSTELVERYWERGDKDKFIDHTDRIKKAIHYLTSLMEDVLTLGKAEAGKISFDPKQTDIKSLCMLIADEARTLLSDNQQLEVDIKFNSETVCADEKLIKYILGNLLSNAAKFSSQGGKIVFSASEKNGCAEFIVSDEGIGIPEEDKKRIYEPFDRGSNIGHIRGSGLGMSIVKRSVDLHNGTIEFVSRINQGTRFTVIIPVK